MDSRPIRNYAWTTGRDLPAVADGEVLDGLNLAQREPHTPIFENRKNLTFRDCLLINCDLPPGSVKEGCNHFHVSLCSHQHEKWVAKGLAACAVDCEHLTREDVVEVDGVQIETIRTYEDRMVI